MRQVVFEGYVITRHDAMKSHDTFASSVRNRKGDDLK